MTTCTTNKKKKSVDPIACRPTSNTPLAPPVSFVAVDTPHSLQAVLQSSDSCNVPNRGVSVVLFALYASQKPPEVRTWRWGLFLLNILRSYDVTVCYATVCTIRYDRNLQMSKILKLLRVWFIFVFLRYPKSGRLVP